MKIQRTIPPAAAPLFWRDLWNGCLGLFSGRQSVQLFEREMKDYFGVKYLFTASSGKGAFTLILHALAEISSRKEVIIPAYTCFSVPSAILKAGLKVKLCDMDSSTFDFDYKSLENSISENTLCVVATHLFGIPSDLDKIKSLCNPEGVFVIEDAAQAMGGVYKGRMLGTIGDAGFFSFGRGKNITCGSGGAILTNSEKIGSRLEKVHSDLETPFFLENIRELLNLFFMKIFIHPSLYWFPAGLPFLKLGDTLFYSDFPIRTFSGFKAMLMKNWKERLNLSNQDRTKNGSSLINSLNFRVQSAKGIPYLRFPILVESKKTRDAIFFLSRRKGLGISVMYPTGINEISNIKELFLKEEFPVSKKISDKLLTIPTHSFMSETDKIEITELILTASN